MKFLEFVLYITMMLTFQQEGYTEIELNELDTLRKRIAKELATTDGSIDDINGKSFILDNLCGMINTEGVCYFNAVIQSLFSSRSFLTFYIMNDFTDKQPLSNIMQTMAYKMLSQKNLDPIPFINKLSTHSRLLNHCTIDGGNPHILLEELLVGLHLEIESQNDLCYMEGAPQNFFYGEKYTTKCINCKKTSTDVIRSPTINIPFSNTIEESIKFYNNIKNTENKNKYYGCGSCETFNPIIADEMIYETILPQNLILVFERVKIKNNFIYCIFQEINLNKNVKINGCEYTLYAAICSHLLKKGYHANAIVNRDGRWIIFNDNQLEIYPLNYEDRSILNNYAWILFYRKVNCK